MKNVKDNIIHPTAVLTGDIKLGVNNEILPYTVLNGPLEIGDNNLIGPHAVIGSPGQTTREPRYDSSSKRIRVGSNNIIREFMAIQKPCFTEITEIGSGIYLMQAVHVPHDALIEDFAVLTPTVVLAGSARILKGANLGLGVTVHQNSVIGQYAMVAMGATVIRNIRPFSKYIPDKPLSVNEYAIDKFGFKAHEEEIRRYVLDGAAPESAALREIHDHYNHFNLASKRSEHR